LGIHDRKSDGIVPIQRGRSALRYLNAVVRQVDLPLEKALRDLDHRLVDGHLDLCDFSVGVGIELQQTAR
jgi:hypothetical protein